MRTPQENERRRGRRKRQIEKRSRWTRRGRVRETTNEVCLEKTEQVRTYRHTALTLLIRLAHTHTHTHNQSINATLLRRRRNTPAAHSSRPTPKTPAYVHASLSHPAPIG